MGLVMDGDLCCLCLRDTQQRSRGGWVGGWGEGWEVRGRCGWVVGGGGADGGEEAVLFSIHSPAARGGDMLWRSSSISPH